MMARRALRRRMAVVVTGACLATGPVVTAADAAAGLAPAVSANGLFLGGYTKKEVPAGAATASTGLYAQSVEVNLTAPVDSSIDAVVTLSLPRARQIAVDEAFVRAQLSPAWQLQAGRFHTAFGRHNLLHPHAYPFLDPPLVLERLFGPDGLVEVGVGLRRGPASLQLVNGDNTLWLNPTDEDLLLLAHLANAWSLGGGQVALGASWAGGANAEERYTQAIGADLSVDLRRGLLQAEYALATESLRAERRTRGGVSSWLGYRLSRRWWGQLRYDYFGLPQEPAQGWEDRVSVLFAFLRSPRFPLRFQYSRWRVEADDRGYNQYHVQLYFAIGPHGAAGD